MLNCLHIENIAVIENADISFSSGFNVLTGETGAGKSIIIDSLNAVLGARTSKELIRKGAENARVVAQFSNIGKNVLDLLENLGLPLDEDRVTIQRVLSLSQSGGFRVNSQPVPAAVVKEIGNELINIHGQHDNQTLLNPEKHKVYIDRIAENDKILEAYSNEFKNLNSIRKELEKLDIDEEEKERRIDLLKFQINEIKTASISLGEFEKLKEQLKSAKEFEKNSKSVNFLLSVLSGEESEGVIEQLKTANKLLATVDNKKVENNSLRLTEIIEDLSDIEAEIRYFSENEMISAENIQNIEDRIDFLRTLMLKYSADEKGLLEYLEKAENELSQITSFDELILSLEEKLETSTNALVLKGEKLTESRVIAARNFEKQVCEVLKYLDMPNVQFTVQIEKGKYTKFGADNIEFMISANAGEDVKPLAKIASGGELSRVMLAIKSVLSKADEINTLIFDEIDSGISGRAAIKVAEQLKKVSDEKQVICVTHLAQIAAAANQHLLINKSVKDNRTYTDVSVLSREERIDEIARIMSGAEITEKLYDSAKELLDRSK